MDHRQIDERDILARYLLGELSEPEEEDFEQHLLVCPRCQDELEAEERFAGAIRSLDASGDLPKPATERRRAWQPMAWAASILFALLPSFFLMRENSQLSQELHQASEQASAQEQAAGDIEDLRHEIEALKAPRSNLALLRLQPVRSLGDSPYRLTLGEEPEWIVLLVEPPEPVGEVYALRLESPAGATIWQAEASPDAYGALSLSLHSAGLDAGLYRLSATSETGTTFQTSVEIRR